MEIVKGHWAFCGNDNTRDHEDAQYKIVLQGTSFWLCEKCFQELMQAMVQALHIPGDICGDRVCDEYGY